MASGTCHLHHPPPYEASVTGANHMPTPSTTVYLIFHTYKQPPTSSEIAGTRHLQRTRTSTRWRRTPDTRMCRNATASKRQATANRLPRTRLNQRQAIAGRRTTMFPTTSRYAIQSDTCEDAIAKDSPTNTFVVRRLRRRSHPAHPHAIHSQGLCHPHLTAPPHYRHELH